VTAAGGVASKFAVSVSLAMQDVVQYGAVSLKKCNRSIITVSHAVREVDVVGLTVWGLV